MTIDIRTAGAAALVLVAGHALAQVPPPTTITVDAIPGNPGAIVQPSTSAIAGGTRYTIGESQGYRPGGAGGVNLLHSFSQFDIGVGDEALFSAGPGLTTENIIGRVTGGSVSSIYGRIASDVAGANLFLLNPAGIFFGSSATLDVQGSFHAGTADTLVMQAAGGALVSAFSGDAALALAHPAAFGFLTPSTATITVNGATLATTDGHGLSLVSDGAIRIGSTDIAVPQTVLSVQGGRLELVSTGGSGDVGIAASPGGLALTPTGLGSAGLIDLDRGQLRLDGAGQITLQAAQVSLTEANPYDPFNPPRPQFSISGDQQPEIESFSSVAGEAGGDIVIRATQLELDGARIRSRADSGNQDAAAGSIHITADDITLDNRAVIEAVAVENSLGGAVNIAAGAGAATSLRLDGESVIDTDTADPSLVGDPSRGGDIDIAGFDEVVLHGLSQIRSDAYGDNARTGNVSVSADLVGLHERSEISSGAFRANLGLAEGEEPGSVFVTADRIELLSGGSIESITVGESGNGGDVVVTVRDLLIEGAFIDESQPDLAQPSGISSTIGFAYDSTGGNILINARPGDAPAERIRLLNGGRIGAESVSGGVGGRIEIRADEITVSGVNQALADILDQIQLPEEIPDDPGIGSVILQVVRNEDFAHSAIAANSLVARALDNNSRPANGLGSAAGEIAITADSITLDDGGQIAAFTEGIGDGGRIGIDTGSLVIAGDGRITTDTTLTAEVALDAGSFEDGGSGGDIEIHAGSVSLRDGAGISSDVGTDATGRGGNVFIEADTIDLAQGTAGAPRVSTDTAGPGAGGNLVLVAHDALTISGAAGGATAGLFASSAFDPDGSESGSGDGAAGGIFIAADRIVMAGGSIAAATGGSGAGGDIVIGSTDALPPALALADAPQATRSLAMTGGASISVLSTGVGNAGDITIDVTDRVTLDRSSITTEAEESFGGSIDIGAGTLFHAFRSQVTAATEASGSGDGGNVAIDAPLIAVNGGLVAASANAGNGGNIALSADRALLASAPVFFESTAEPGTVFDATSELGVDGQVTLSAPEVNLDSGLAALTAEFLDPSRLLRPTCDVAGNATQGSFAVRPRASGASARDDLPPPPSADGETRLAAAGPPESAEARLTRGITIASAANDNQLASQLSNVLGNRLSDDQQAGQAVDAYREAARLARLAGDAAGEARALSSAARAAARAGNAAAAGELLRQAAAALPAGGAARTDAAVSVARSHIELAEAGIDRAGGLAAAHRLLTDAAAEAGVRSDSRALSAALGYTGRLYELEARVREALYLTRQALQLAGSVEDTDLLYRWHWQSARLLRASGDEAGALEAYRSAVAFLEESRQDTLARSGAAEVDFRRAVAPVYREFVDLLLRMPDGAPAFDARLTEARATMELLKGAELRDYFRNACIAELESRTESLDAIAGDAAVIYPILLEDRLEILVRAGGRLHRARSAVGAAEIERTAQSFRAALQVTGSDAYRAPARQLYDWIVRPVEPVLASTGAKTLVFVPGGALRAIPMAALLDGERFLVERYSLAVTPTLSLIDPQPLDPEDVRLFAAGISESVRGQPALPGVPGELESIRGIFGGQTLLNGEFEVERVRAAVTAERPNIVHIASHGVFTGDPDESYLLAWDAPLTMEQLGDIIGVARFRDDPLGLLVLSACQTAEGDDRAALGLAGVAIRAGARSAMGSLWSISDDATAALVKNFYGELRKPGTSRAEALRRAQAALLAEQRFAHPFFWSPFLMINNWL